MDIIAHGLWAVAAAKGKKDLGGMTIPPTWTAWWAVFPDVLAFGPSVAVGLWLLLAGGPPHIRIVNFGLPLYQAGHSLVVFTLAFGVVWAAMRRPAIALLGWLSHIVIDIFTHSFRFYATRFLWPLSDYRFDGIAWRTPWFWACTYIALALVYFLLWRSGRLTGRAVAACVPQSASDGRD
jgi:hypothetical protein